MSTERVAVVTGGAGFTPPLRTDVADAHRNRENGRGSMHYVYVLRSLGKGSLYIGCTSDLKKRLKLHQDRRVLATKSKGPWEILYYEAYHQQAIAYRRERTLKQFGGAYRQLKRRLIPEGGSE